MLSPRAKPATCTPDETPSVWCFCVVGPPANRNGDSIGAGAAPDPNVSVTRSMAVKHIWGPALPSSWSNLRLALEAPPKPHAQPHSRNCSRDGPAHLVERSASHHTTQDSGQAQSVATPEFPIIPSDTTLSMTLDGWFSTLASGLDAATRMGCHCRGNSPQHPGLLLSSKTGSTPDTCIGRSARPVLASDDRPSKHGPAAGVASSCVDTPERRRRT
jgi:hypothetical protein